MSIQQAVELQIPEWTFGDKIRKARSITGMDQRAFAGALGITSSTLAAYETGRANPRFKDAGALAVRLEMLTRIPRAWFLGFNGRSSDYTSAVADLAKEREKRHPSSVTHPRNRVGSTGPKKRAA
jgi:transcriptional regulator with XRE-family HTH domain